MIGIRSRIGDPTNDFEVVGVEAATLQPAVIVGLGYFGTDVCDIIRRRHTLRRLFSPRASAAEENLVRIVDLGNEAQEFDPDSPFSLLFDGADSRAALAEAAAAALEPVTTTIHNQLQDAATTRSQPHSLWVRPTIYLVASVAEMIGSAALAPLARALVEAISHDIQFNLVGIVMVGHHEDQPQLRQRAEALAFVALRELNQLVPKPVDDFETLDEPPIFEHLYIIDHVKANNSTLSPLPGVSADEAEQNVANFLEALTLSALGAFIQRQLLDDYTSPSSLSLATFGSSSLVVPIDRLWDVLRRESVAQLLKTHFSNIDSEERRLMQEVAAFRFTQFQDTYQEALSKFFRAELPQSTQEKVGGLWIDGVSSSLTFTPTGTPRLARFQPWVEWEGLKRLDSASIQELFTAEQDTIARFARRTGSALLTGSVRDQAGHSIVAARAELVERLNGDERGLTRALTYGKSLERLVSDHVAEIDAWYRQHDAVNTKRRPWRWFARVMESERADERLEQISQWLSYPSAILVRATLLWVVLYQFYFDALRADVRFWPLAVMPDAMPYTIAWALAGIIFFVALVATVLPLMVLHGERRLRRLAAGRNALHHVQENVQDSHRQYWDDLFMALRRDVRVLESHYRDMLAHSDALEQSVQSLMLPASNDSYLERAVISVQALKAEQSPLPSNSAYVPFLRALKWYRADGARSLDPAFLLPVTEVNSLIDEAAAELLRLQISARSVEDYLDAMLDHQPLDQLAYDSAVPWLLTTATPTYEDEEEFVPEHLAIEVRVSPGRAQRARHSSADRTRAVAQVEGLDRFRATLLRLQYGLEFEQINRVAKMARSFQLLSAPLRADYIHDEALFVDYPPLRAGPSPLPDEEELLTDEEPFASEADSKASGALDATALFALIEARDNLNRAVVATRNDPANNMTYENELRESTRVLAELDVRVWRPELGIDPTPDLYRINVAGGSTSSLYPAGTIVEVWRDAYDIPGHYFDSSPGDDFTLVGDRWIRCAQVIASIGVPDTATAEGDDE